MQIWQKSGACFLAGVALSQGQVDFTAGAALSQGSTDFVAGAALSQGQVQRLWRKIDRSIGFRYIG